MFIRNRNNYLLLENLKQAREYLTKKSIPLDLPEFHHITKSLNKLPNLIDPFTRMIFQEDAEDLDMGSIMPKIEIFDRIVDWIKSNKHIMSKLPKNISQYKDLEHLEDDISHLKRNQEIHKFIQSLYRSMRDEIKGLDGDKAEQFRELAYAFMQLDDEKKSQFTPLKYFEKNDISIEDFMSSLNTFVNGQDTNENKKRIYQYIEDNPDKVEVTYDKDNVLVIQTNDGESVCELGSQGWCIVYSPGSYQKRYFGPETGNTQYIIHNFNLPTSSKYSMFGVTIEIDGKAPWGGAQNKTNGGMDLKKIYELTEIPEGTLVSMYKEEYDKLLIDMQKINYESHYSDVLNVRKNSIKMGIKSKTTNLVDTWLSEYVSGKKLPEIDEVKEFINEINNIDKIAEELSTTVFFDEIKLKFVRKKADQAMLHKSVSIEKLHDDIMNLKILSDTLGIEDSSFLTTHTFGWFTNVVTDNADEIISLLYKMSINEYNQPFKKYIGGYLNKYHKDTIKILIDEITKDKETLTKYFIEEHQLIQMLKIPFKYYIDNTDGLDLTETVFLYYVFKHHVDPEGEIEVDDKDSSKYNTKKIATEFDISGIPANKLTIDLVEDYLKSFDVIVDKLLEVPLSYNGKELSRSDIVILTNDDIFTVAENYMDVENRESFEEIKYGYKTLFEYFNDEDENYIIGNLFKIYEKFEKDYDIMLEFFTDLSKKEHFNPTELLNIDNIYDPTKIDDDYLKFLGSIMVNSGVNLENYTNDIVNYSAGLVDHKYMNKFYNAIGLTYHEEHKKWYMLSNYDELGDYFESKFDFEDFWEYGWNDYDYSDDCIDDMDIENLTTLSKYFKSNGFDIDITSLDKYNVPENLNQGGNININYKDSMEYYRSDRELYSLLSTVEEILKNDFDWSDEDGDGDDPYENVDVDEIRSYISNSYQRADESARQSEMFNSQASIIGDAFLEQWPDGAGSYANSYFKWNDKSASENDGIIVIPDLDILMDGQWVDMIAYQCGLDDITIEHMISAHQDDQGKLSWAYDNGYASFDDEDYDYYNEELTNALYENDIEVDEGIKENVILKLSDYHRLSSNNRYIKLFEDFNDPLTKLKEWAYEYAKTNHDGLNDYEDAVEELDTFFGDGGEYSRYSKGSFKLLRVVQVENKEDINVNEIGDHYLDPVYKERIYEKPWVEMVMDTTDYESLFLLEVEVTSDMVDWENTIHNRLNFPREFEITLDKSPKVISITKIDKDKIR
tara:strand:- start:6592 stop:10296 length:3705 start_codon:yes stop_codon:yes gene_type:complete